MKTIGLVGGTGWVSSVDYYRIINEETNKALGGLQSAKCILFSINFGELMAFKARDDEEGIYAMLLDAANKVIKIGADCILLCANTLHKYADRLEKEISVPMIHIASATAMEIKKMKLSKVGLLGTKYTMEEDFYISKLNRENIDVCVPSAEDRAFIHTTIFEELLKEIFKKESKERIIKIMNKLKIEGAEGIILGCTEIPLIIKAGDFDLPLFNTTEIHARAAVNFALAG